MDQPNQTTDAYVEVRNASPTAAPFLLPPFLLSCSPFPSNALKLISLGETERLLCEQD